jgi:type I restriction enzyme S subunit
MSEWKEISLGEIVTFQRGYDLPQTEFIPGPYLVAGSNGGIGYHNKFTTKGPGLTLGRSGNSIGVVHYYENDFWAHNTTLFSKEFRDAFPKFVYYLLQTLDLKILDGGSAVPTLNRNHVHPIRTKIPPLPEQRAIAGVLSSLDDKIDLLHRQNKTLEAIAEALWRKMFVEEADPGWKQKGLDEIAIFLNGLPCQNYPPDTISESLPVIKIKELRNGFTEGSDWATSNAPPEYIINNGDMLFSWSGSLELVIWSFGKGVLNQHLFKVTTIDYPQWFIYFWIKHYLPDFRDIAQDKATTMGHIQRNHLSEAKALVPDENTLKLIDTEIRPLFDKMVHNLMATQGLIRLRDLLLPKLMSGEVRAKV